MDDVTFARGPARRPMPRVADPLLQWATGLQTKERRIYAGWLVEAGKIDTLDEAMGQAGFSQVTIKHGSGNMVTHWAVETANLFVIAEGVQSMAEMKHTTERYGIAFGWRSLDGYQVSGAGYRGGDETPKPGTRNPAPRMQSVLRFRAFLHELLEIGFYEPLLVTAMSTLIGDVITALMRQYDVLDAIDAFRAKSGKPPQHPPFYACSIPLGPGQEVARGSVQTKEITPVVAHIPTPITREYILAHWIKRDWVPLVEGLMDQTIAWSTTTSQLIAAGEEQASGAQVDEEPQAAVRVPPAPPSNGQRQMEESLL